MKYRAYFISFLSLFIFTAFLLKNFNKNSCSYLIVLDNNEKIKAKKINWYKSGFVDVRKCNGTSSTLRENTIDTIISIKK
jgi:hypothetical protein